MSDTAIEVVNLSKKYRIGGRKASYGTIRESIVSAAAAPVRRAGQILRGQPPSSNGHDEIWALKDVSFEVKRGEVVGIIGPNGAGKSTLLKILSRITRPTEGFASIHGRVGSLLEVGTGFHPELTGRENIYLSGAVLGMKRIEIEGKFDEIVDYSGVEKFIDTAVKHFSSGMYLRLAFAVAAHLDPEILLVDEVLAVGDAAFQKKCLGKMGDVAKAGRTVILVSHNMSAIASLCDRVILLNQGSLVDDGTPSSAIGTYLERASANAIRSYDNEDYIKGRRGFRLAEVRTLDKQGQVRSDFRNMEPVLVQIDFHMHQPIPHLKIGFQLRTASGEAVFQSFHNDLKEVLDYVANPGAMYCLQSTISGGLLNQGTYYLDILVGIHRQEWLVREESALRIDVLFDVPNADFVIKRRNGIIAPILSWNQVHDRRSRPKT